MQVLSIVAGLLTMAFVTGSYQRFESQHIVGRAYPWSTAAQIAWQRHRLQCTTEPPRPVRATLESMGVGYAQIPPLAEDVATKSLHLGEFNLNDEIASISSDEENEDGPHKVRHFLAQRSIESNQDTVDEVLMDRTPHAPPPPPPPLQLGLPTVGVVMNRMSTFTEMMLLRTELYLRDHVPRVPDNFHLNHQQKAAEAAPDHPDGGDAELLMPTRRPMLDGIEQDDFLGKTVSFCAWYLVLLQRMIALSGFAYFHPLACLYFGIAHYALMLVALLVETRLHEKAERLAFYLFLAYVYVFCIIEFKIKFRRPRRTLVAYAVLVMVQNVAMSAWWFGRRENGRIASALLALDEGSGGGEGAVEAAVSAAWWFGFMFAAVLLCGMYALVCWVVYYYLLKPSARLLFEAAREAEEEAATAHRRDGTNV